MTTFIYTAVAYDPSYTADCMGVCTSTDARTAVADAIDDLMENAGGGIVLPSPIGDIVNAVLLTGSYGRNGEYGDEDKLYVRIEKFKVATTILSISAK